MPTPSPLASLPRALVESIFTYAVSSPSPLGDKCQRSSLVHQELKRLASVSREWNAYARDVASAITLHSLTMDITNFKSRHDMEKMRLNVILRRGFVRELELRDINSYSYNTLVCPIPLSQWRVVFSHTPQLRTLDLQLLGRSDARRLARVIQAAREQCPHLQRLMVPTRDPMRTGFVGEDPEYTQALMDAVLASKDPISLRELRMGFPTVVHPASWQVTTQYLLKICDVCPDLEVFNGYSDLLGQTELFTCTEQWFITTATWEKFCSSLTKLKTFNWIVAPFATPFFEIFGRYPKLQLEKLMFSTPMNWDWNQYRLDLGIPKTTTGYGATASNAHEALKACPNLRALDVTVYLPGGDGEGSDDGFGWDEFGFHGQQLHEQGAPEELMMNQEIFGDQFCQAVVENCTKLERFSISRVFSSANVTQTIMSFTDKAMEALATLPNLNCVELESVNITGDGLFSLVGCFAHDSQYPTVRHVFDITVGDTEGSPTDKAFYNNVEGFLDKLATCEPEELLCANRRVVLCLRNGCFDAIDRDLSADFLIRVRQLARIATAKHPSIGLRLLTRGYCRGDKTTPASCDEIVEFGFYTNGTMVSKAWRWMDDPEDTCIDGMVFNRGPFVTKNHSVPGA